MNELKHKQAFAAALADYQLSAEAQTILARVKLVLLTGPTGAGRNTVIAELMKSGKYYFLVSDTTRQPRVNNGVLEQDGREYWFRDEANMLHDIQHGDFLEAEIIHNQQVSGISIRELRRAFEADKTAISDIDLGGTQNVLALKPDATIIVMLPPSFATWRARVEGRGQMDAAELRRRLATACTIFATALERKESLKFVINDTVEYAARQVNALIAGDYLEASMQRQAEELTAELLADTRRFLESSASSASG